MPNEMTPLEAAKILEKRMKRYHPSDSITTATKLAVSVLRRAALGELAPVVHAHWIEMDDDCSNIWKCSHCGLVWEMSNDSTPQENEMLHCPKCGAVMDESDMRQTQGGKALKERKA